MPDDLLREMGRTGSGPRVLEMLVADQRRRRLLVLRALLDAVRAAPAGTLPAGTAEGVLRDWKLLEEAEQADPAAARRIVHYAHTGPWAERCLRALTVTGQAHRAAAGLPYLAALGAAAAARAGLRFSTDVPVRNGELTLPTLGHYRPPAGMGYPGTVSRVQVKGDGNLLWLHLDGRAVDHARDHASRRPDVPHAVEVRRGPDGVWRSAAPGWRPLQALRTEDGQTVLIDDADPYRDEERHSNPYGLVAADTVDAVARTQWHTAWRDAQPWLRLGDGTRAQEAAALLDCFVPLAGLPTAHCSATRREAFGALLSTTPHSGLELAGTVVHELQHTKLLALSEATVLHTADNTPAYWAPWRPDPRPFDGLFQGAYAHLALADFYLKVALTDTVPARRDTAWADHCRCRQQVEAALPALLGSNRLTPQGRTLVKEMAAHHTRLKENSPPDGHLARAAAYVETSRVIWRRQRA
ncbi:HEXXH motif-containing putative peptide modification protein [Streptomyces sp. NPDC051976]|uniref:aKG-HExxH-type peptide beta-hydroxylase n=1 Tax=Streptomyces sp. NPDC051976 TaxID=3154947 RepID=UPI003424FB45